MRKLAVLPILLIIAACASLGVPQADTFNKRVVVANGIVESTTATIETLFVAGKLSKDEAQQANDRAKDLATGIDVARQAYPTDPVGADDRLTAAITALNALNTFLETRR